LTGGTFNLPSQFSLVVRNTISDKNGANQLTITANPSQLNQALSQIQMQGLPSQSGQMTIDLQLIDTVSSPLFADQRNVANASIKINLTTVNDLNCLN
jgi:hypothetical protein